MTHTLAEPIVHSKSIVMHIPAREAVVYPIMIESNWLFNPERWMPDGWETKKIVIITDDQVKQLYGERLSHALEKSKPLLLSFSPGEASKNSRTKSQLEEAMLQHRCGRETLILALGGGVVGDVAGFVAATYMRGISYIQIPTTLLAMVDSSVGGKTGIDTPQGKNLIGAYWQPLRVIVDVDCLKTLSTQHIIHGLIEAIKIFSTKDIAYFNYVVKNIDCILNKDISVLKPIIERAIQLKVDVVSADETEKNQRMILNFGHTIGHALEKVTDYKMLHGDAVAVGILVEAKISQLLGLLSAAEYQVIRSLLFKLNMTGFSLKKMSCSDILEATKVDKKIKDNQVRYVLLKKIGQICQAGNAFSHFVPDEIVAESLLIVSEE